MATGKQLKQLQSLVLQQQALINQQNDEIDLLRRNIAAMSDAMAGLQRELERVGHNFSQAVVALDEAGYELVFEGSPVEVVDEKDPKPSDGG